MDTGWRRAWQCHPAPASLAAEGSWAAGAVIGPQDPVHALHLWWEAPKALKPRCRLFAGRTFNMHRPADCRLIIPYLIPAVLQTVAATSADAAEAAGGGKTAAAAPPDCKRTRTCEKLLELPCLQGRT